MKKILFLAALSFLFFQNLYAFSPLEQSIVEISDIVNSRELRRLLPPYEAILDIRRVPSGYLISTNRAQLFVEVRYRLKAGQQPKEDEKKSFDLKFSEPTNQGQTYR